MAAKTEIILSAKDETAAAFASAKSGIVGLAQSMSGINLASGLGLTAAVTGLAALTTSSITYMASLHDMAIATGASVESLSAMKTAAKLSGTTLEEAAGAMKKLGISLGEAQLKGGDKAKLFEQLGIDPKTTKDTGLALFDLAKKLDVMPDKFKALSIARDLSGRNVSMPFLQELAQMESLQAKVTTAQAAAADQFEDNVIKFKSGAAQMGTAMANAVLPGMNDILSFSLQVKKEWGALAAIIVGLGGGTLLQGLGVELDPLKRAAKESTAAINELIAARKALADQTASAESRKSQLGPLGQFIIDKKVEGAGDAVTAARARSRAALAAEASLFAEDEKQKYAEYLRKKAGADLPDKVEKEKKDKRNTDLERMLKLGQQNLNAGIDSEEEARLIATKREMEDVRKEFEALQRMLKVGEDNELAAYYETAGEEVMRLVGEQQNLKAASEEVNRLNSYAKDMGLTFSSAFEDAALEGKKFSEVLQGLAKDVQRIVLRKSVTEPLGNAVSDLVKGGGGDLLGSFKKMLGFASGGSFTVGGGGGTDSQLVAFRATPGENVTISTPSQRGGAQIIINDQRTAPSAAPVGIEQGSSADGMQQIRILIRDEVRGQIGSGSLDASMRASYGVSRSLTRRG